MKKTITIALLTAAVIGATSFFSSCSIKNDDDSDWIIDRRPDPVTIDLSKVFTNGTPKEVDSMTIQTNEKGLVTSIETKDEMVSFKLLLSDKNKLKVLHLFTQRCCSCFTYPGAWFSVSNCKHYKMCLF